MIDFSLTDEQKLIMESLEELLKSVFPHEREMECWEKAEFPWEAWQALADNGFLALGQPESVGGVPCDCVTQALVCFTLSRFGGPLASMYSMGIPTMYDIIEFGTQEQIEKYVQKYLNGGPALALGISEPGTGSDVSSMSTSYRWEGDTAVINGGKHYTTYGMEVDAIIVMARDAESTESLHKCGTMFIVDKDTPGVRVTRLKKYGHETNDGSICEVFLNDVRVPRSAILGVEHNGFAQTMANFGRERIATVAGVLAGAVNAFEDACRYANQRVQFGQQIGKFQLTQEKIVRMAAKIQAMTNMVYHLCWKVDNNMDIRIDAGLAKYYIPQTCCEVVDDALQILAGIGIVGEHRVGRMYTSTRTSRVGGGSDEVMIINTAPQILKKYR